MTDTEKLTSPFSPAEWGETYTLAGAEWSTVLLAPKHQPDTGTITIGTILPTLDAVWKVWGKYNRDDWRNSRLPLLPSPDWINAQADPRAVVIAALERVGFENQCTRWAILIGDTADQPELRFWIDQGMFGLSTPNECFDPALARYAVDCFAVLHAWAAAVKWEARDE